MRLCGFGLLVVTLLGVLVPCNATCSDWTMPEPGERVEILLRFGELVSGTILEVDSEHISIMRQDKLQGEARIPRAAVAGIRRAGETVFCTLSGEQLPEGSDRLIGPVPVPTRTIRVKVYDKLPALGLAIAGGVFAGHRFGQASSEHDLARSLEQLGLSEDAKSLESSADSHEGQAWIGVVIGLVGLVAACIPSYEEIALPQISAREGDLGTIEIGYDLACLISGRERASAKAAAMPRHNDRK